MKLWPTVWEMIEESVESHCDLICAKCRQPLFDLWPLGKKHAFHILSDLIEKEGSQRVKRPAGAFFN
jgi:hypothetical protein